MRTYEDRPKGLENRKWAKNALCQQDTGDRLVKFAAANTRQDPKNNDPYNTNLRDLRFIDQKTQQKICVANPDKNKQVHIKIRCR